MTLSKQWFDDEINRWTAHKESCKKQSDKDMTLGIISGLKIAYKELVVPPPQKSKPKKDINIDKGYENIVKFYMDKKGYSKEEANRIAQRSMTDQIQKRL